MNQPQPGDIIRITEENQGVRPSHRCLMMIPEEEASSLYAHYPTPQIRARFLQYDSEQPGDFTHQWVRELHLDTDKVEIV